MSNSSPRSLIILTTIKLEKPVVDDDRDFFASGGNLARRRQTPGGETNEVCVGGRQLLLKILKTFTSRTPFQRHG